MAELTRIKKERAEEAARKAAEDAKVRQSQLQAEVAGGNPLINQNIDFTVSMSCHPDTVRFHSIGWWMGQLGIMLSTLGLACLHCLTAACLLDDQA